MSWSGRCAGAGSVGAQLRSSFSRAPGVQQQHASVAALWVPYQQRQALRRSQRASQVA